jgi:hypothetical protein
VTVGKTTTGTSLTVEELGSLTADLSLPSTFPEELDESRVVAQDDIERAVGHKESVAASRSAT